MPSQTVKMYALGRGQHHNDEEPAGRGASFHAFKMAKLMPCARLCSHASFWLKRGRSSPAGRFRSSAVRFTVFWGRVSGRCGSKDLHFSPERCGPADQLWMLGAA